jgi:hypothetical protein
VLIEVVAGCPYDNLPNGFLSTNGVVTFSIIAPIGRRAHSLDMAVLEDLMIMMKAIREAEDGKQKEPV